MNIMLLNRTGNRFFLAAVMVAVGLIWSSWALAYTIGLEKVTGHRISGVFEWDFKYTRSFDGTKFTKHLEIDFLFDADLGYDDAAKVAWRAGIEANIEEKWNNKFFIEDRANGNLFPLTVDVTTGGPFDQTVSVHKAPAVGFGPTDMLNWYTNDLAATNSRVAHEFGHMLGLFDEYNGGALDPASPILSNNGIMGLGANLANPVMYPRYYQQYLDYMNNLNKGNFQLKAIPEPSSLLLILLGECILVSSRFRFRPWRGNLSAGGHS